MKIALIFRRVNDDRTLINQQGSPIFTWLLKILQVYERKGKAVWFCLVRFGLIWFYGISTIVGYLMPNPVHIYIYIARERERENIDNEVIQAEGEINWETKLTL